MREIECGYCRDKKIIMMELRDYVYKRRDKHRDKIVYFCSYNCMRNSERENPNTYSERRL